MKRVGDVEPNHPGATKLDQSVRGRLATLADAADVPELAGAARELDERLAEGRFYVACVGQFKRGKSTLLNALVGASVLPVGVVPVTAVVTVLRYGRTLGARVRFGGGAWRNIQVEDLSELVAEERNPENRLGVTAVEVFVPSPLLATGLSLVDTPGIGSVFVGNTAATRAFVPHIDVALVVLGADPPISGDEMALVLEVARQVRHVVFVLNKADRISGAELREAGEFTHRLLQERLGRAVPMPFSVSAIERIRGGPTRDWSALETELLGLASDSGAALVAAAELRGLELIAARLLHELEERRAALVRPVEESRRRLTELRRVVGDAERALGDLGLLLSAEEQRLARRFTERRDEFLRGVAVRARAELDDAIAGAEERRGKALRERAFALAREVAHRHLDPWLAAQQALAEREYREVMARFIELANQFLDRVAASGEHAPANLQRLDAEAGFRVKSGYFATELLHLTMRSPGSVIADLARPRSRALPAIQRDVGAYLARLIDTNGSRIEGDLRERVLESRRRLESDVRARLREVYGSAERALARAETRAREGAEAIASELAHVDSLRREVLELHPDPTAGNPR